MRALVVIPAFNETASLPDVISDVRSASHTSQAVLDIVVIDDGSTDSTAAVASAHGARVLRLCSNLGIGGAVQAGLRAALRDGYDCALQLDGDGQHPASEIMGLLAALKSDPVPDLVVGTRYLTGKTFRSTALRRLGGRWLSTLLRIIAGLRVTDPTSGYRLYGPRALALFDRTYPYDYPEPESLAVAAAVGLRILEVPVKMRERQHGRSSIAGLAAPYYMLKTTLAIVLSYLRNRRFRNGART